MYTVAVLENTGESVLKQIKIALRKLQSAVGCVSIWGIEASSCRGSPDLTVISPSCSNLSAGCFKSLLVPSDLLLPSAVSVNPMIISYGLSSKDSITLSSISAKRLVITIQREFCTLGGKQVERQEIPVEPHSPPLETLASIAALLIIGVEPGALISGTNNHITSTS